VVVSVGVIQDASVVGSIGAALASVVRSVGGALVSVVGSVGVALARSGTTREVIRDSLHINCREIVTGSTWRR
jgi:hypothetical protein